MASRDVKFFHRECGICHTLISANSIKERDLKWRLHAKANHPEIPKPSKTGQVLNSGIVKPHETASLIPAATLANSLILNAKLKAGAQRFNSPTVTITEAKASF